jgi:hypothetical protein
MSLPTLEDARLFARRSFRNLAAADQLVRYRLCEYVEKSVMATALDENLDVLRTASYLQEIGVIHSSREKAIYSLQMCERYFEESVGELDERLKDTILNHVRTGKPRTAEARLMRICHKYAVTHYLDYMLLKHQISSKKFEELQLERIESYAADLRAHPRGREIGTLLHAIFYARGSVALHP